MGVGASGTEDPGTEPRPGTHSLARSELLDQIQALARGNRRHLLRRVLPGAGLTGYMALLAVTGVGSPAAVFSGIFAALTAREAVKQWRFRTRQRDLAKELASLDPGPPDSDAQRGRRGLRSGRT